MYIIPGYINVIETFFFFRLTIVSSDTRFPFLHFSFDWIVGSDVGMRGVGYVRVCQGITGNYGLWERESKAGSVWDGRRVA